MARTRSRPRARAERERQLVPLRTACAVCEGPLWQEYWNERTVLLLDGLVHCRLAIRRCQDRACPRFHQPYRPEALGALALPPSEIGLDVIALVGAQRSTHHQTVPEIHWGPRARGLEVCKRTVTRLVQRYEELVALRLADHDHLRDAPQQMVRRDALLRVHLVEQFRLEGLAAEHLSASRVLVRQAQTDLQPTHTGPGPGESGNRPDRVHGGEPVVSIHETGDGAITAENRRTQPIDPLGRSAAPACARGGGPGLFAPAGTGLAAGRVLPPTHRRASTSEMTRKERG